MQDSLESTPQLGTAINRRCLIEPEVCAQVTVAPGN